MDNDRRDKALVPAVIIHTRERLGTIYGCVGMQRERSIQPFRSSILSLVVFLLLTAGAAAFGGMFTQGTWYDSLTKPALNPPGWIFGPVWTILYILMALAAWLVWRTESQKSERGIAIGLFLLQLLLNAFWSWIFFGMHDLTWALIDILALNLLIIATIIAFYRINRTAAWMIVPYWLWVSFATYLTWAIRGLN